MQKKPMVFCEAPLCVGSPTRGTENAYRALLANGLRDLFGDHASFWDYTEQRVWPEERADRHLRDLETVMGVNRAQYKRLLRAFDEGGFPVNLGGDHSLAMASIAAASAHFGTDDLAVIYIDGHTDINTEQTTASGCIHGMPLAAAMGLCDDALTVGQKVNLKGENTFILGARSIDPPEYGIVRQQGVTLYTAADLVRDGTDGALDRVIATVSGKAVHLSFDVDAIDGADFSATGYVMPDGLPFTAVKHILTRILAETDVVSMDCVEYNPARDTDGDGAKKVLDLLKLLQ